jgi:hypothetical protein
MDEGRLAGNTFTEQPEFPELMPITADCHFCPVAHLDRHEQIFLVSF